MLKKIIVLFILPILFFLLPTKIFTQEFELGTHRYKQEGGKWYIYNKGSKCDRVVPNRLIVRKKSKERPTKSDLDNLSISNTKVFNKRYTGGYYVLNINESENSFEIAEKLKKIGFT